MMLFYDHFRHARTIVLTFPSTLDLYAKRYREDEMFLRNLFCVNLFEMVKFCDSIVEVAECKVNLLFCSLLVKKDVG